MNTLTPHQEKALDFKHSVSLSANAGSGKTFVLAKRYLRIAIEGEVPLRKIAAITFTDKAAGELYKRIAVEIETQINETDDVKLISKLEHIRRQLVSANVSTIHSFCLNILREFPVEADLDANFTPIDETISQELLELSIEELTKEKLENTDDDVKSLIRILSSKKNLVDELRKLILHRKIVIRLKDKLYSKDENDIANAFNLLYTEYLKKILAVQSGKLIETLKEINDTVKYRNPENELAGKTEVLLDKLDENKPVQFIEYLNLISDEILTKSGTLKKAGYLPSSEREGLESKIVYVEDNLNELTTLKQTENHVKTNLELARIGKAFIRLFDATINLYDEKKKESGYLDYEDILIKTKQILQIESVQKSLSKKFTFLMVDEYQDTNDLQYQIFMPILDYLKTGNLFVVGDEKQSIYRFRDAELEVFSLTNEDIKNNAGEKYILTLPDSFRMYPEICLFTNVLFRNVFITPSPLFNEVSYTDLICARDEKLKGSVSILLAENQGDFTESELIANQIKKIVSDKSEELSWKDFAILVRKRSAFKELEKEFIKQNIPYSIIGGKGFYQRQSVYDIYNYFSFLLDPENDAALTGLLRSPFYSFSDLQLFSLSREPGKTFWMKLISASKKDDKVKQVVNQLSENLRLSGELDIISVMRKIFNETPFISVLASKPDSEQELANISKLIQLTINFTNQGFRTLYDYLQYLKESINKTEEEAQAGLPSQTDAVNILTLHQSKGLEFPVVFLFKCDEPARISRVKSRSLNTDKNLGLLTKVPLDKNYFAEYKSPPVVSLYNYIEKKKTLAEVKRLFYVGVTRAEKHLYICATVKNNKTFDKSSFLGLMINGLAIQELTEEITLKDELTFLVKDIDSYKNKSKQSEIHIPVIRSVENEIQVVQKSKISTSQKTFKLDKIEDNIEGEFISATKVATYNQCPLKYKLIYVLGFSPLNSNFKEWQKERKSNGKLNLLPNTNDEKWLDEDIMNISALKKGRLIHKILQLDLRGNQLEKFLKKELKPDQLDKKISNIEANLLIDEVNRFYNSKLYTELKQYKNYNNEFEVYLGENGYFLYGIIDKLIFSQKNVIILDYKTDDIDENEIRTKAENYFIQLKFYLYIVSKLFPNFEKFIIRIVFIKYPDLFFEKEFDRKELAGLKKEIGLIIKNMMAGNYGKNTNHCNKCGFSINHSECIIH